MVTGFDSEENGGNDVKITAPISYTEIFRKQCPYYMAIGMSRDEFWNGDVEAVRDYRKAHHLRNKLKNEELWLLGGYVYKAIGAYAQIFPAFPKAGAKVEPYLDKPFHFSEMTKKEEQETQTKAGIDYMKSKMMTINRKRGETDGRNS